MMAPHVPLAFVVRNRWGWLMAGSALLVVLGSGCSHYGRRSSLRPVYVSPGRTVVVPSSPCPAGQDCGGASLSAPAFPESGLPPSGPSLSPSTSQPLNEPQLEPAPTSPPASSAPDLLSPSGEAPRRETRRPTTQRATYRSRVASYVNDPEDLFQPPKADRGWKYVVLHHSATAEGSYADIDREHRERLGTKGCGYHFVIGNGSHSPDGQIEVTQRWSDQRAGAHCRDATSAAMSDYGIGICLVGDFDQAEPTARQLEAAEALVAYLQDRYEIAGNHIGPHGQFTRNPTVCPGKHFPTRFADSSRAHLN